MRTIALHLQAKKGKKSGGVPAPRTLQFKFQKWETVRIRVVRNRYHFWVSELHRFHFNGIYSLICSTLTQMEAPIISVGLTSSIINGT